MQHSNLLHKQCRELINAYKHGLLGPTIMPEDTNPGFSDDQKELRLNYFTLPMALNYQRDSYKLWEAAKKTYSDNSTTDVFVIKKVSRQDESTVRRKLLKYKLALQPNKHINTWLTLTKTIEKNWGSILLLLKSVDYDFLKLKKLVQKDMKIHFPYLSGPKIFNYWAYILINYGQIELTNSEYMEIAPDTHVIKCSILLNVISKEEANSLSRDEISNRWRLVLKESGILPIEMHSPLWFWSRNDFEYKLILA